MAKQWVQLLTDSSFGLMVWWCGQRVRHKVRNVSGKWYVQLGWGVVNRAPKNWKREAGVGAWGPTVGLGERRKFFWAGVRLTGSPPSLCPCPKPAPPNPAAVHQVKQ